MRLPPSSTPSVAYCPGTKWKSLFDPMRNFQRSEAISTRWVTRAWKNLSSTTVISQSPKPHDNESPSNAGECGRVKWRDNTRQKVQLTTERSFDTRKDQ